MPLPVPCKSKNYSELLYSTKLGTVYVPENMIYIIHLPEDFAGDPILCVWHIYSQTFRMM